MRGFTLIEVLMVIAVIAVIGGVSLPMYNNYRIRNDLATAKNQVTQGLQRAKLSAEAGKNDSAWGFQVPQGVLYKGSAYNPSDPVQVAGWERYPMPASISVTGLADVSYNRSGVPSVTGDITLRAANGNTAMPVIVIQVNTRTIVVTGGDGFRICRRNPPPSGPWQTITVDDASWPTYKAQGATMGPCAD